MPGKDLKLRVQLVDNFNRVIKEQYFDARAKETSFSFSLDNPLSILMKVKAGLLDGDIVVDENSREFVSAKRRKWDDFIFRVWGIRGPDKGGTPWHWAESQRKLYEVYGVDTTVEGVYAERKDRTLEHVEAQAEAYLSKGRAIARANISPGFAMFGGEFAGSRVLAGPNDLEKLLCLTDPAMRKKRAELAAERARATAIFRPSHYSLGDENCLWSIFGRMTPPDICFSPSCQEDFRKYLKEQYGSLEALNKEWETGFKDWPEVTPVTLEEAKKKGNYAPWIDHRMHMETVFADSQKEVRDIIHSIDPAPWIGISSLFSQVWNSYVGFDFWKLSKFQTFWDPYRQHLTPPTACEEILRSFGKKDDLYGQIYAGYIVHRDNEDFQRFMPWNILFHGYNSAGVYHVEPGLWESLMKGDFSAVPTWTWNVEEIGEIKSGVGKLILSSQREDDRIAIHYSQSSMHAGTAFSSIGSVIDSQKNFFLLLEDLGLQYKFVSYEQVENGELTGQGYKVLILPFSQSVSGKEAGRIKEFVRNGGTVIADLRSGIMDGHGKLLKEGALDEVFGISRKNAAVATADLSVWREAVVEQGIEPAGSTPLEKSGQVPLVMVNAYGKGKAVYFNILMDKYKRERSMGGGEEMRRLMNSLLKDQAGVESRITITAPRPDPAGYERTIFRAGKAEYVGILKNLAGREDVEIRFPYKAHVYDLRQKKYHGYTDSVSAGMQYGRAKLYGLMPYEVTGLSLKMKGEYKQGETAAYELEVGISGGEPLPHVVRVEVYGPDGKLRRYYTCNILLENGAYRGGIPLALNEQEGEWKVVARETVSGKTAEHRFNVVRDNGDSPLSEET